MVGEGRIWDELGPFCAQKSTKIAKNRSEFWSIFVDDKGVIVIFRVSECIKSPPSLFAAWTEAFGKAELAGLAGLAALEKKPTVGFRWRRARVRKGSGVGGASGVNGAGKTGDSRIPAAAACGSRGAILECSVFEWKRIMERLCAKEW
jgi:hypothetical protein